MSTAAVEPAEIVIAFVVREDGRFLVQPREGDRALAGLWELPGGKVAPGEPHASALAREVREETGLEVEVGELVCALCHAYADRRVALHAYRCAPRRGAETGPRGRWVTAGEYRALPMPDANPPLLAALGPCGD